MPFARCSFVAAALLLPVSAQPTLPSLDPEGLPGARLLAGGGKLPPAIYARFLELAGGEAARIVVIPTASATADKPEQRDATLARWRNDHPGIAVSLLHTRERAQADDAAFCAPLREATGVWFGGGAQERLAQAYLGTRVETEIAALLARGGVVGGTSAGTAIQTRTMIQEGKDPPVLAQGFDLVPLAISDQHFLARSRLPRLLQALAMRPGHFGAGVDEGTALEVRGRELRVHGVSKVLLVAAASEGRAQRVVELAAGEAADLVSWQRVARARAAPRPAFGVPRVTHGALVLVGGGQVPRAVSERFAQLAGGASAKVVVVTGAMPRGDDREPFAAQLRALGVREVRVLDCRHPREVTAEKLALLADATGVWFGGGRQWRLVDAYEGTPALAAFHAVLARGGVIGGTSAGATIQGEFLVRGNPLGNAEMWCEAYDRGFGFLPGCAVDQHFVVRDRLADLRGLIAQLPEVVGLGIDEATAVVVQGSRCEVLGDSRVAVIDRRQGGDGAPVWHAAGATFDLASAR